MLLLSTSIAGAAPWSSEADHLAKEPSPTRRLALGTSMSEELPLEAILTLSSLTADPQLKIAARDALAELLLTQPITPSLRQTYLDVASTQTDKTRRYALRARAALAATSTPELDSAAAEMNRLLTESPNTPEAVLALADVELRRGNLRAARDAFRRDLTLAEAREGLLLVALVDPTLSPASWWADAASNSPFAAAVAPALGGRAASKVDITTLQTILLGPPEPEATRFLYPTAPHADLVGALAMPTQIRRGAMLETYGYPGLAERALASKSVATGTLGDEVAAFHMLGRLRLDRGDPAGAVSAFRSAVSADPSQDWLFERLIEALVAQGQLDVAERELSRRPNTRSSRRLAAARALLTPTRDDDAPALSAALEATPEHPTLSAQLGRWLLDEGRAADAKDPLKVAIDKGPWSPELALQLIDAALAAGDPQTALAEARRLGAANAANFPVLSGTWTRAAEHAKVSGTPAEAVDAYAVAHALSPEDPGLLRAFGGALWSTRPNDAFTVYQAAVEADPTNRDGIDAMVKLAVQTGQQDAARALLQRQTVPEAREALVNFELLSVLSSAERARAAGRLRDAERAYRSILETAPDNASALRGLGSIALERGQEAEAAEFFERARAATPEDVWSQLNEANGLIAVRQFDPALSILDTLAEVDDVSLQKEVRLARSRLDMERAIQLHEQGELMESHAAFRTSLDADPNNTWAYTNLGNLYASTNQYDLARAAYEEARIVDPTNIYATTGIAHLHIDRGQLDAASELLSSLPPTNSHVRAARSRIEVVRGAWRVSDAHEADEHDNARTMMQALYNRYPDQDAAREAWEEEFYGLGDAEKRYVTARGVLAKDPANRPALEAALKASHELGNTAALQTAVEGARRLAGEEFDDLVAQTALQIAIQKALEQERGGFHAAAVQTMIAATRQPISPTSQTLAGHAWRELGDLQRAHASFDAAIPFVDAALGKAQTLDTQGQSAQAISVLSPLWERHHQPEIGLELVRRLNQRRDRATAQEVLAQVGEVLRQGAPPAEPLPPVVFPSGGVATAFPTDDTTRPLNTTLDREYKKLLGNGPEGVHRAGISFGPAIYARPGVAGKQFLTAFMLPIRVHTIGRGPISFDVEAVGTMLSDTHDTARGVQLSAGLTAAAGPVDVHLRGGVSPLGFEATPYATWAGSVDVRAFSLLDFGVYTSREPVTDTLTSWAGKELPDGTRFGRVHRTTIGGLLDIHPAEATTIRLSGEGGWTEGLGVDNNRFWKAQLLGGHTLSSAIANLYVGVDAHALSYEENQLGFASGKAGVFSPQMFIDGSARLRGTVHTRNDRFRVCAGGRIGVQSLSMDTEGLDADTRLSTGLSLGYDVTAAIDWRMGEFWWLGIDYGRESIATTWVHDVAMLHLHFGPNNAWERSRQPVFSPLAGVPLRSAQGCN